MGERETEIGFMVSRETARFRNRAMAIHAAPVSGRKILDGGMGFGLAKRHAVDVLVQKGSAVSDFFRDFLGRGRAVHERVPEKRRHGGRMDNTPHKIVRDSQLQKETPSEEGVFPSVVRL